MYFVDLGEITSGASYSPPSNGMKTPALLAPQNEWSGKSDDIIKWTHYKNKALNPY